MKIGLSIPRSPDPEGLRRFAQRAEQLGFESVLAGDHIVLPTDGTTQYGFVANFAQEVEKGQLPLSVGELRGQGVEQFGRSAAFVFLLDHQLSLLDHMHEFDTDQRILSRRKRLEPQHGPCHPFDCSVILFHDVV